MPNDPEHKSLKTPPLEDAICLSCQKPFKTPDKKRIRICKNCKHRRTRSQEYDQPVTQSPYP